MITVKRKIFLVLLGLITILLLFEVTLRAFGYVYYSSRIKNEVPSRNNDNATKVLCLGDSFTFGVGAPKGHSYPEQLGKMLNENNSNHKFIVYTTGIPGSNSSQLLKHMEELIQKYNPNILVIMIGISNKDCIQESNYFLFSSGIKAQIYKLDSFLSRVRSYKLLRIILRRMGEKILSQRNIAKRVILTDDPKPLSLKRDKLVSQPVASSEIHNKDIQPYLKLGREYLDNGKVKLAIEEFKKATNLNPYDERSYIELAHVYIYCQHQYELAIEKLKKALRINPKSIVAFKCLWEAYYGLGENELALKALKKYLYLEENSDSGFSQFLLTGLPSRGDDRTFERLLRCDLDNIVKLARSRGSKLILQNYPAKGGSFNENYIIKEIADKYKIPFVDNTLIFEKLKRSENYKEQDYFAEDGHPNANGYRIIAENVYNVLQEMELSK